MCSGLFARLKAWFDVPAVIQSDLTAVDADCVVRDLRDPQLVAAFAMRKLQALHLLSIPERREIACGHFCLTAIAEDPPRTA